MSRTYWEVGSTAPDSGGVCEMVHQSIVILICGDVLDIVNLVDDLYRACNLYRLQAIHKFLVLVYARGASSNMSAHTLLTAC